MPLNHIFKNSVVKGTLILTIAGLISKLMGFYYKIFLSGVIGAEGIGLYQLVFPITGIAMAVCSMGIENAISRFCAKEKDKAGILTAGLIMSLSLAFVTSYIIYHNAAFIAKRLLLNENAGSLVLVISVSIPFACLHQCICGYYYGTGDAKVPAVSQLFEQFARVGSVLAITFFLNKNSLPVTPVIAVAGIVAGEITSGLFCLLCATVGQHFRPVFRNIKPHIRDITGMALPISCNRILLTLLQSGEAILIPAQLTVSGMSSFDALSAYGVLTGMAMSFIAFPATITQSAAVMLLPSVSKAQSSDNSGMISRTISTSIEMALAMGIFCIGSFITYGAPFGALIFHNNLVADFMRVLAWLCPFLYINTTLTGILNGLGKTGYTFVCGIISTLMRIAFIIFLIPSYKITGYMWGLLVSQCFLTGAYVIFLLRLYHFSFSPVRAIVVPVLSLAVALCGSVLACILALSMAVPYIFCLIAGACAAALIYCGLLFIFYRSFT